MARAPRPSVEPSMRPNIQASMVSASNPEPRASMTVDRSPWPVGSTRTAATNAAMLSAMSMRNMNRQPAASTRKPPRMGPATVAMPSSGPKMLNASRSTSRSKLRFMLREALRNCEGAEGTLHHTGRDGHCRVGGNSPQAAEARVKPARPIRKRRHWPNLSPSRPPSTGSTPIGPTPAVRIVRLRAVLAGQGVARGVCRMPLRSICTPHV